MRKFRFRLERVLSFRRSITNQAKSELAVKIGDLTRAERNAGELKNSRNNLVLYRMQGFVKGITAGEAVNLHEHLIRTGEAVGKAESKVEEKKVVVAGARKKLLEKRRDEIAIDNLRKRRFKNWLKEYYRDESRQLDDIATVKHTRQKTVER